MSKISNNKELTEKIINLDKNKSLKDTLTYIEKIKNIQNE